MFDFLNEKDRQPPTLPQGPVRRRYSIEGQVQGVVTSSHELSKRSFGFWLKCFLVTAWAWCSRYWVVNALLFVI